MGRPLLFLAVTALLLALTARAGALSTHGDSRILAKPTAAAAAGGLPALRSSAAPAPHAVLALRGGAPPLVPLIVAATAAGTFAGVLRLNEDIRTAVMRWLDKNLLRKLPKFGRGKKLRQDVRSTVPWAEELQPSDEISSGYPSR